jgi:Gpi18-like mannosyltransferase
VKNEVYILMVMLSLAFLIRIYIAGSVAGYPTDMVTFASWANTAGGDLFNIYRKSTFCDYPPLYLYVLAVIGKLIALPGMSDYQTILLKLPSILSDLALALVLYRLAEPRLKKGGAVLIAYACAFNPVFILDSSAWGQVDSFFTLLILIALHKLVGKRIVESTLFFALATLMKPQSLFFLPILLFVYAKRRNLKEFLWSVLVGLVTVVILVVPFSRDPFWILSLYEGTADGYKYASLNAFNLFSMIGANTRVDSELLLGISFMVWGFIFDLLVLISSGWIFFRMNHRASPLLAAIYLSSGAFMLSSRMHERYYFPILVLLLFAYVEMLDIRFLKLFAVFSVTNFLNIGEVLYLTLKTNYPHIAPDDRLLIFGSTVNILAYGWMASIILKMVWPKNNQNLKKQLQHK